MYEAAIQKAFVEAFNRLYADREQLLEDYSFFIDILTDTAALDAEAAAQASERDITEELIRKCVAENSRVAQNQDEYNQRYGALAARYEVAQKRLTEISAERQNRAAKRESVSRFMDSFQRSGLQAEFNEGLWCELVETVTVHSEKDVAFSFRDGSVIHVDAR